MHNLEYIGKRLFGLEWEDLNEQDRKTCAIVEQREILLAKESRKLY